MKTLELPNGTRVIGCVQRLFRCVRSLGLRLGWRYWRIQNRAIVNPWLLLEWADNCDREAERLDTMDEGLLANAHRQWAVELRSAYDRWKAPNARTEPLPPEAGVDETKNL